MYSCIITLLSYLSFVIAGNVTVSGTDKTKTCTVYANGSQQDDVPHIKEAFETCGTDGIVIFPASETYWIASRLNPTFNNVHIEWRGVWQYSDNLTYWRNNGYPIVFQNHHAGFIISGSRINITGYGTGGIDGNGNVWYNAEQNITHPGRPMPFVFWNVSEVAVTDFFVKDPQLWSLNIMNGTNMRFSGIYCNATALNAPYGVNWVQNTDGFDTMDVNNVWLENFVYEGGDDCIAIKPRSYNVNVNNVTCAGGNGIAIGSLGQYLEDSSVENVQVNNVKIVPARSGVGPGNGACIKTWIGSLALQTAGNGGYESGGVPRGGGWGVVRNCLFSNFHLQNPRVGTAISQTSGHNGSAYLPSKMQVSNVVFVNFTGTVNSTKGYNELGCSTTHPCFNIAYENVLNSTGKDVNYIVENNTVSESFFVPSNGYFDW